MSETRGSTRLSLCSRGPWMRPPGNNTQHFNIFRFSETTLLVWKWIVVVLKRRFSKRVGRDQPPQNSVLGHTDIQTSSHTYSFVILTLNCPESSMYSIDVMSIYK